MDWTPIVDFLNTLSPIVSYILTGLGALVVIGIAVDTLVPDDKDGGFMKKILAIPVLGSLLEALKKFSPFNTKE